MAKGKQEQAERRAVDRGRCTAGEESDYRRALYDADNTEDPQGAPRD
jgi:hypothetical protein